MVTGSGIIATNETINGADHGWRRQFPLITLLFMLQNGTEILCITWRSQTPVVKIEEDSELPTSPIAGLSIPSQQLDEIESCGSSLDWCSITPTSNSYAFDK